jgi:hypothetical protein
VLTLPPARLKYEADRAAEIQRAEAALVRERLAWFGAAMGCVAVALWMVGMGLHAERLSIGSIWVGGGALLGEFGLLVVLLIAVRREEM